MERNIRIKLERENNNMKSSAEGVINAENFEEMAEEIERWMENGAEATVLGIEEK